MTINTLWNPYHRIAGWPALFTGLPLIGLLAATACFTGTHFHGYSFLYFAKDTSYLAFISEQVLSWIVTAMVLYLSGILLSVSKIRLIDVLGTTALHVIHCFSLQYSA